MSDYLDSQQLDIHLRGLHPSCLLIFHLLDEHPQIIIILLVQFVLLF